MNKVTLRVLQNSKIRLSLETAGVLACRALQMVLVYLQAREGACTPITTRGRLIMGKFCNTLCNP